MQDLHAEIRTAIALNNLDRARDLLRQALRGEPDAETYYLASQVAISDEQKREFLRKALELDPFHAGAQYALERLKLLSRASAAPSEVSYSYSEPMAPLYKPKPAEDVQLAGIGARFFAMLIDGIILSILGSVIGVAYSFLVPAPRSFSELQLQSLVVNLIGLVVSTFYYVYFLTNHNGQTPGKAALGIRIVKLDGTRLTAWDAVVRNVIGYAVSSLVFLLGYFWALWDDKRQGWHDKLARTIVVRTR